MFDLKELDDYPGFYAIPDYPDYGISQDGLVFNVTRQTFLSGSVNPAGYHNFRIQSSSGKILTWGRHRLLAFVFKNPGVPIDDLVVNHKNGIKGDDRLDNLEWVTEVENIEHAGALGINPKCRPVDVRDVKTGIIMRFPSFIKCAKYFGVSKDTIAWRLRYDDQREFPEGRQYRYSQVTGPWPHPDYTGPVGKEHPVIVRYLISGISVQYDSQREAAKALGISDGCISTWLSNNENLPVRRGLLQIKYLHDPQHWVTPRKLFTEYFQTTNQRAVGVRDHNSGTKSIVIYSSANECCRALGLKPTALNHRLKSSGQTVYSDGRSYFYLDELESCPVRQKCLTDSSLIDGKPLRDLHTKLS